MTYLAWRTQHGAIVAEQRPALTLAPRDVRVRVAAVSLNFRDLVFIHGNERRAAVDDRVPCSDAAGVVEAVGEAVTRWRPGDRVAATFLPDWLDGPLSADGFAAPRASKARDGVLAEVLTLDEDEFVRVPDHLDLRAAATLPVAALTAWHAVAELRAVQAGDTVVVQTTGGVAVFALQFCVALGARVIVVSRSAAKLQRARDLGAAVAIDSSVHPAWEHQVLAATGGCGAQLVLDMGLTDSLRRSARAAVYEGTVAVVGVVQEHSNPVDLYDVMNKNLRIRGVETGSRAMFERMNAFIAQHGLQPVVDGVYPVAQLDAALARLAGSPFGKVVVDVG